MSEVAAPTGNDQIDQIIREFALTSDELRRFLESEPRSYASMVNIAQRITGSRRDGVDTGCGSPAPGSVEPADGEAA